MEVLLAEPGLLGHDALESALYILREQLMVRGWARSRRYTKSISTWPHQPEKVAAQKGLSRYRPSMDSPRVHGWRCRGTWALTEPSAVLLWRLGMTWSLLVAVVDALTGRGMVLSGLVLLGPYCVLFTGRWLRTAVAGFVGISLVVVLGIPDGIWGTSLERFLIGLAVLVAATSTLALVVTARTALSLMFTAYLATACGSPATTTIGTAAPGRSAAPRPVACRQQYQAWEHGPSSAEQKMAATVSAVQTAEQSGNISAVRSALRKLMPAAVAAAKAPPPRCTDPGSLYGEYVTAVYLAGYDAHAAAGTSDLLTAAGPLKGLKTIQSQLVAEARRATVKTSD